MTDTPVLRQTGYRCLWAKSNPRHPLWKHLTDAAAVSMSLSPSGIGFGWGAEATALLVGLHDIGKADSGFQHQNPPDFSEELKNAGFEPTGDARCRHERISAIFVADMLKKEDIDPYVADAVSRVLIVHHGYWHESTRDVGAIYREAQNRLCGMLQRAIGLTSFPKAMPPDLSAFGMRLAGHVVLCDWIASNEKFIGDARWRKRPRTDPFCGARGRSDIHANVIICQSPFTIREKIKILQDQDS